jgi:biotin carboxyl carrier protein
MERYRTYGGDVVVAEGRSIIVAAPFSGTVRAPESGSLQPGATVRQGQAVFSLLPLVTPESRLSMATARVDAEGLVKNARIQADFAKAALERAQRLFREDAGSKRMAEEAQEKYDLAQKSLEAAETRRDVVVRMVGEIEKGTAAAIAVESPLAGMLRNVAAISEQSVPTGSRLFEVVDIDRLWIRVPVYVGELAEIAVADNAGIGDLRPNPRQPLCLAEPVAAPPTATPAAATVDLYYLIDNRGRVLTPGERVGVTLRLRGAATNLTTPWSAVVHDINGGTWVYERTGERTYVRRRVVVEYVDRGRAVLASGPAEGTAIVVEGAQELFGTETGYGK